MCQLFNYISYKLGFDFSILYDEIGVVLATTVDKHGWNWFVVWVKNVLLGSANVKVRV